MAKGFGATTKGLNELDKLLKVLPKRTNNKSIPMALKFGATPVVKAMQANIPKNINIKFKSGKEFTSSDLKVVKELRGRPGDKYIIIGTKTLEGFKNFPLWIEFGTLAKRTKPLKNPRSKEGKELARLGVGLVKHPFARPALHQTAKIANARMGEKIQEQIDNQVDLILKRGKV